LLLRLASSAAVIALWTLPTPARADCENGGSSVFCTGIDTQGFRALQDAVSVRVAPGAVVYNIDNGERVGLCPLALPSLQLGDRSSVRNEGTIATTGVCGFGISLGNAGVVINTGTIATQDVIGFGITAGDGLSVVNTGTIHTAGRGAFGIVAGDGSTVASSGTISTAGNGASAIALGATALVTNTGVLNTAGDIAYGVDAGADAAVSNNGTIATTGALASGIRGNGGTLTVTNSGQITVTPSRGVGASTHGAGIDLTGDSVNLTNSGAVTSTFAAIHSATTGQTTIVNSGTLRATPELRTSGAAPASAAIYIDQAGRTEITNSGQIIGDGLAAIRVTTGNVILTNSGTISGDVIFGAGDDMYAPKAGSSLTGTLDGGAGNNFLFLDGGGDFATKVVNFTLMIKNGAGTWTLHNTQTMSFQANVLDGVLRLASDARLIAPAIGIVDGILAGTGVADGTVTNSALVAPGYVDHAAALTITGGYIQDKTGALAVGLNGDGTNDKLIVGGPVTLAGTLHLTYDRALVASHFAGRRNYTIIAPLSSAFAVQGGFSVITSNAAFIDAKLTTTSDGLSVDLAQLSYGVAAATASQRAAGAMLDRLAAAPPAPLAPVVAALDTGGMDTARGVLAALASESVPALQNVGLLTLESLRAQVAGELSEGGYRAWAQYLDRSGLASRGDSERFHYGVNGVRAGFEARLGDTSRAGFMLAHTDADATADTERGAFTGNFIGATFGYAFGGIDLDAGAIYGAANPDLHRSRTLLGVSNALSAHTSAELWSLHATVRDRIPMGPVAFIPSVTLAYDRIGISAAGEQAPLALDIGASYAQSLRPEIGLRGELLSGSVHPYLGVQAAAELLSRNRTAPARLVGVSGSDFVLAGARPRAFSVAIDGGVAVDIAAGLSAHAGAQFTSNLIAGHAVNAGLTYRW